FSDRIHGTVEWVLSSYFPSLVCKMFEIEPRPDPTTSAEIFQRNIQLFRFLAGIRERRNRVASLVRDCIPILLDDPLYFRGCYFAGIGKDPLSEQAFTADVLKLLIREQENVSWTTSAIQRDARFAQRARQLRWALSSVIGLLIIAILVMIGVYYS